VMAGPRRSPARRKQSAVNRKRTDKHNHSDNQRSRTSTVSVIGHKLFRANHKFRWRRLYRALYRHRTTDRIVVSPGRALPTQQRLRRLPRTRTVSILRGRATSVRPFRPRLRSRSSRQHRSPLSVRTTARRCHARHQSNRRNPFNRTTLNRASRGAQAVLSIQNRRRRRRSRRRRPKCRSVNRLRSEKNAPHRLPRSVRTIRLGLEDVKTNSPRVRKVSKTEGAATIGDSVSGVLRRS